MEHAEPFVPIEKVADHFAVSISTVRTWIRTDNLPKDSFLKIGNTYRFRLSEVSDALMKAKDTEESA
jgi:predicted DNA-binding transcriptional regulator AlpA|tara:strand:- start:174 stop:374 length:201 start_codon:yes stop_codon:yes gene_type:complete